MRAARALIASFGTSTSMLAAATCLVALASTLVAFDGWPVSKLASDVGPQTVTAIEVNVTNGVATLAGSVRGDEEKRKAEAAARSVEGIAGVNNNLQVNAVEAAPSPTPGMATTPVTPAPTP